MNFYRDGEVFRYRHYEWNGMSSDGKMKTANICRIKVLPDKTDQTVSPVKVEIQLSKHIGSEADLADEFEKTIKPPLHDIIRNMRMGPVGMGYIRQNYNIIE